MQVIRISCKKEEKYKNLRRGALIYGRFVLPCFQGCGTHRFQVAKSQLTRIYALNNGIIEGIADDCSALGAVTVALLRHGKFS